MDERLIVGMIHGWENIERGKVHIAVVEVSMHVDVGVLQQRVH